MVPMAGLVNVDFADVNTSMQNQGLALMGTGRSTGPKRSVEAMQTAISSPLLEDVSIDGALGILVNITGPRDISLMEIDEAMGLIQAAADPDVNIIFGALVNEDMQDEVKITLIATGFQPAKDARVKGLSSGLATPTRTTARVPVRAAAGDSRSSEANGRQLRSPSRERPPIPLEDVVTAGTPGLPGLPGLEEQYDIPAFLRRNPPKND
jgi:cell division protein FtsZ